MATLGMDRRIDDPLVAARIAGFLVNPRQESALGWTYYLWCHDHDNPYVDIRMIQESADILLDLNVCSWHFPRIGGRDHLEEWARTLTIALNRGKRRRLAPVSFIMNATEMRFWDVPAHLAPRVARCLYRLALASRPPNPALDEVLVKAERREIERRAPDRDRLRVVADLAPTLDPWLDDCHDDPIFDGGVTNEDLGIDAAIGAIRTALTAAPDDDARYGLLHCIAQGYCLHCGAHMEDGICHCMNDG